MRILCPGKTKKKRFDKLRMFSASGRLLIDTDYIKPLLSGDEEEFEAEEEEFEDLQDTANAFELAIEIAGEIW